MDTGKKITEEFQKYIVQIKPTEKNVESQQARSEKEPEDSPKTGEESSDERNGT